MPWAVPPDFALEKSRYAETQVWVHGLGDLAEQVAAEWHVQSDGPPWTGHMSCVWPVRGTEGEPLALKLTHPGAHRRSEAAALGSWAGSAAVVLHRADPHRGALLLQRLDATRSLDGEPIDLAVEVIAGLMHRLHQVGPPPDVPALTVEAIRVCESLERHVRSHPLVLDRRLVDAARATLREVISQGQTGTERLLHGDLHFLNVLRTLPELDHEPAWLAIDPLPCAGPPEWDITAMLRNRFAGAVASGDADRALRRRVDVVADRTGMSATLARRLAQAVAVDNLGWLLPREPAHMFVAPYQVIAEWVS